MSSLWFVVVSCSFCVWCFSKWVLVVFFNFCKFLLIVVVVMLRVCVVECRLLCLVMVIRYCSCCSFSLGGCVMGLFFGGFMKGCGEDKCCIVFVYLFFDLIGFIYVNELLM